MPTRERSAGRWVSASNRSPQDRSSGAGPGDRPRSTAWRRVRPTLGLSVRSKARRRGPRLQLSKDEPNGSLDPAPRAHRGRRGRALRTSPHDRPAAAGTVGRRTGEPVCDLDGGREALPELRDGQSLDGVALHRLQDTAPRLTGARSRRPDHTTGRRRSAGTAAIRAASSSLTSRATTPDAPSPAAARPSPIITMQNGHDVATVDAPVSRT